MKPGNPITASQKGFTLVELIITIIVAGILGAFFIHFMGTALSRSSEAVSIVQDECRAEDVMEEIIADYVQAVNSDPATALSSLVTKNTNRDYGTGVAMQYIAFDTSGIEYSPPPQMTVLKVTVQDGGSKLTTLLTLDRESTSPPVAF
jgi:prepilin-type N-terminal cleavage/methylation domain-containing protein